MKSGRQWMGLGACVMLLGVTPVSAQWGECAAAVNALTTASSETQEATARIAALNTRRERGEEDFARCRRTLEQYRVDIQRQATVPPLVSRDGCRQEAMAVQSAETQQASEIEAVRPVFVALADAVQAVEQACGVPLAAVQPLVAVPRSPACEGFLAQRPGVPLASLRVVCPSELSEEECRACLGEPAR